MPGISDFSTSEKIAILAIVIPIIFKYVTQIFKKYKSSSPTESEIQFVIQFLDFLSDYKILLCYYKNDYSKNYRRVFTIEGNLFQLATLKNKIEKQIDKSTLSYPLIINSDYTEKNLAANFMNNRLLPKQIKECLRKLELEKFGKEILSSENLFATKNNFLLIDSKNPLVIIIGKGIVPYRRIAIRNFSYCYVNFKGKKMTAIKLNSLFESLNKRVEKWLTMRGLKDLYQEKISQLNLASIEEIFDRLQNKIDEDLSIDLFRVAADSPIHKEIESLVL